MNSFETARGLMIEDRVDDIKNGLAGCRAEDLLREGERDIRARGRKLIEERLRVAHAPC